MPNENNDWTPEELELRTEIENYLHIVHEDVRKFALETAAKLDVCEAMAAQIVGKSMLNLATHIIGVSVDDDSLDTRLFDLVMAELDKWQEEESQKQLEGDSEQPE